MYEKNGSGINLCIFGGTFDPPHISHTLGCLYALEVFGIDRILVIPCFHHPFGKNATPFIHRVAMCRVAMECMAPRVEVSEIEAERSGPSYTIDTLEILRQRRPGDKLFIMIGSDILQETRLWKSFEEIERMAEFIVLPRPSTKKDDSIHKTHSDFTLPDISSTEIRQMLKQGKDVSRFLSIKVREYISRNDLYT